MRNKRIKVLKNLKQLFVNKNEISRKKLKLIMMMKSLMAHTIRIILNMMRMNSQKKNQNS